MKRQFLSILLALCMVLTWLPTSVLAADEDSGRCYHHAEHDVFCGYVEAVEGQPCTHKHTDDCYHALVEERENTINETNEELISDVADLESDTVELNCQHIHDEFCGYVEAVKGRSCTYICEICNMAEADEEQPVGTEEESEADVFSSTPMTTSTPNIWDGTVATSYAGGTGSQSNPYLISTPQQLALFASRVNSGAEVSSSSYSFKYYRLTCDIYLNDISNWEYWDKNPPANEWTPIGTSSNQFTSHFSGNGFSVYGLYISTGENYQGLFGYASGDSYIGNIGVEKSFVHGGSCVGGICGYRGGGGWLMINDWSGCHSSATVSGSTYVGGVVGKISAYDNMGTFTINNFYNLGDITGTQYVGGVVGGTDTLALSGCYNTGSVRGNKNVGGIAGTAYRASSCWNAGDVSGLSTDSGDTQYIGGIMGYGFHVGDTSSAISNCFNAGSITGGSYIGGILGYSTVTSGLYPSAISNCYNIGNLAGIGDYVGGVSGQGWLCSYSNCYNAGKCSLDNGENVDAISNDGMRNESNNLYYLAGCCGVDYQNRWSVVSEISSNEMRESSFVSTLNNGGTAWIQDADSKYNSGYPILSGIDYAIYSKYASKHDDNTENGIAIFSTEKSLTVKTGESMQLGFGQIINGQLVENWKRMAIAVSDPTVISLSEYEETEYGYLINVNGEKQGITNVTISDTESGVNTVIQVSVCDQYTKTYSYGVDTMPSFYPNNPWEKNIKTNIYDLNGIYINKYKAELDTRNHVYKVSFDAYNSRYYRGAVDIYDENGNWLRFEEIKGYNNPTSVLNTGNQAIHLITDLKNGKLLTYEQASFAMHTPNISFEVPENGYFTISNNIATSPGTYFSNAFEILFDAASTILDLAMSEDIKKTAFDGFAADAKKSFTERMVNVLIDNAEAKENVQKELLGTLESKIRNTTKKYTNAWATDILTDECEEITDIAENFLESLDISWKDLFKSSAGCGESIFTKLSGPAGIALKGCFSLNKNLNKLVMAVQMGASTDNTYATVYTPQLGSFVNQNGVVINTEEMINTETVLQVFRLSNHAEMNDFPGSGKPYEMYSICLVKNDQLVQPSGKVAVYIPVPMGVNGNTCTIYRQEVDGEWTPLTAHVEGSYIVFETDHFSLYTIVGDFLDINISSLPNKLSYAEGDSLDTTGLIIDVNGEHCSKGFICSPMVLSGCGIQTITVTYGHATTEFSVNVSNTQSAPSTVHTVTFDANGGTVSTTTMTTGTDGKLSSLPTATCSGYIFDGWYTVANGGTKVDESKVYTEDTTLYAQWTQEQEDTPPVASSYTITFDANGGTVSTTTMTTGTDGKLSSLPTATRSGYTFNGWYTAPSGGNKVATDTVFNSDTTVYARWTYIGTSTPSNPSTPSTPSNPGGWYPGSYNPPATSYSISVPSVTGGTVSVSPTSAVPGSTVTITTTPNDGYELATLTVTDTNGNSLELADKGDGKYSFKMPNSRVSIDAEFKPVGIDVPWNNPFVDVSIGDWYYDAVKFVNQNGLMNGAGNGIFAPSAQLSRAMLAEILYNKEGRPAVIGGITFADVQPGAWYADAVTWASGKGIVDGYGNGFFGPNDDITREQVAVMLYRYAGSPVPPNLLLNFTDAYKVSDWAQDAVRWAVDRDILNGKGNGILDPLGKATRAEAAQMLKNYLEK